MRHRREQFRHASADHQRDDLSVGCSIQLALPHRPTVAKDRVTVADLSDLFEEMADVDDPHAGVAQLANDGEEVLNILASQRTGRLIEHDHLRVGGERPRDLNELLLSNRELTHWRLGSQIGMAERIESLAHFLALGLPIEQPKPSAFLPKHDVVLDRQVRCEVQLLIDHAHASEPRVVRPLRRVRLSRQQHAPRVRPMCPAEHFHQRALPRAVLTDQREDSPGGNTQRNIRQRLSRSKPLRDVSR